MKNKGTHMLHKMERILAEYEKSNHGRWIETTRKIAITSRKSKYKILMDKLFASMRKLHSFVNKLLCVLV